MKNCLYKAHTKLSGCISQSKLRQNQKWQLSIFESHKSKCFDRLQTFDIIISSEKYTINRKRIPVYREGYLICQKEKL